MIIAEHEEDGAMHTSMARRTAGFTLIEALIAITILSIGLMAVVSMIDVSFSAGNLSRNTTKATHLAAWMIDRLRQDTTNKNQKFTADINAIRSFDNDASASVIIDTSVAGDPALEPGLSAARQWRALIQGTTVPVGGQNYIGTAELAGDRLPQAQGVMQITPYDPNHGGHHFVEVRIIWQEVLPHRVTFETILASSE